jgi:uncharacterized damage-inducible protein DinB
MISDHLRIMCDYNYWAHHQLWDCVLGLSEAQFTSRDSDFKASVHEEIVQILGSEWLWMARLRGVSPSSNLTPALLPTRDSIRERWAGVESELRAYASTIRETQLNEIITYMTTRGAPQRNARWEILAHVLNHSTDCRARVSMMLMLQGVEAPSIALLDYLRSNELIRNRIALEPFHREAPL